MRLHLSLFAGIISLAFIFSSCDEGESNDIPPIEKFPSLKVENQVEDSLPFNITSISLTGYQFDQFFIPSGESATFILDQGMPEGYQGIEVVVRFGTIGVDRSETITIDFQNGKTSAITLKGCEMAEGCNGFYLE